MSQHTPKPGDTLVLDGRPRRITGTSDGRVAFAWDVPRTDGPTTVRTGVARLADCYLGKDGKWYLWGRELPHGVRGVKPGTVVALPEPAAAATQTTDAGAV